MYKCILKTVNKYFFNIYKKYVYKCTRPSLARLLFFSS